MWIPMEESVGRVNLRGVNQGEGAAGNANIFGLLIGAGDLSLGHLPDGWEAVIAIAAERERDFHADCPTGKAAL
jgi:hypothetical protein